MIDIYIYYIYYWLLWLLWFSKKKKKKKKLCLKKLKYIFIYRVDIYKSEKWKKLKIFIFILI